MPRILVLADGLDPQPTVVHEERVAPMHFDDDHCCAQLIERVGWAVLDADELEGPPGST